MDVETVEIGGHLVDARYADLFFDGRTGEPITDEQWDEQLRRIRVHEPNFTIPKVARP